MKKAFSAILCFLLVFSLFGCSGDPTEPTNSTVGVNSEASNTADTAESSSIMSSDGATSSLNNGETSSNVSQSTNKPTSSTTKPPKDEQSQNKPTYEEPVEWPQEPDVETVTLPDVTGENSDDAKSALLIGGIKSVKIVEEYSSSVKKGKVIRQIPKGGTKIKENELKDTVVTLYVSKGIELVLPSFPDTPISITKNVWHNSLGQKVYVTAEVVNLEWREKYLGFEIVATVKNKSIYTIRGGSYIKFKFYDKNNVVIKTLLCDISMGPGETVKGNTKVTLSADELSQISKVTIDRDSCTFIPG